MYSQSVPNDKMKYCCEFPGIEALARGRRVEKDDERQENIL